MGYKLASDEFLQALQEYNATGYSVKEAKCTRWYVGKETFDADKVNLKRLVIEGRCGNLRTIEGDGAFWPKCEACGRKLRIQKPLNPLYEGKLYSAIGAKFDEISYYAINNNSGAYKAPCENCQHTFGIN